MRYLLDFDGVIYNTEALKEAMTALGLREAARAPELFVRMKELDPAFDPKAFVFKDASQFLSAHAHKCAIVSSYLSSIPEYNRDVTQQRNYQETKILLSGVLETIGREHLYIVGESKAEALALLKQSCDAQGTPCVFIDDREVYVEEARALGIPAVWMNRQGHTPKLTAAPAVKSLDEVETVQLWKQ